MADPKGLGARLRQMREARGLSLRQTAFTGCSPSYLSRVESGERVASISILAELARRLGSSVEELLGQSPDGRVPESELVAAEVASRLGSPEAEPQAAAVLASARALRDAPAESRMLECLGLIAIGRREDGRAIELLEAARAADPHPQVRVRPALYRALGRAYAGSGDLVQATAVLREGFDEACTSPPDVSLMVQFGSYLANAYTDRGRYADAERVLETVLGHEREIEGANLTRLDWALARTYSEQGKSRIAEVYAERVLARMQSGEELRAEGHAHLLIAGILLDQGEALRAADHLDRAERLLAGEAPVELALLSYERSRLSLAENDHQAAKEHAQVMLDRTRDTEPGYAGMAYALLAEVELADGNVDDARFLCTEGIGLMRDRAAPPYLVRAFETLSRVEERAGDLAAALDALRSRPALPSGW